MIWAYIICIMVRAPVFAHPRRSPNLFLRDECSSRRSEGYSMPFVTVSVFLLFFPTKVTDCVRQQLIRCKRD